MPGLPSTGTPLDMVTELLDPAILTDALAGAGGGGGLPGIPETGTPLDMVTSLLDPSVLTDLAAGGVQVVACQASHPQARLWTH